MYTKTKSILLSCLLVFSSTIQAQDIDLTLTQLKLSATIKSDLDMGLTDIAKESSWNRAELMRLFNIMNATLQDEYNIDTTSSDDLYNYMAKLDSTVLYDTGVAKISSSNYKSNKETHMQNALYLALMGKTLKHYLDVKYDIALEEQASYIAAFNTLARVADWNITQRFIRLKDLLSIYHIELEWLPNMLEQL